MKLLPALFFFSGCAGFTLADALLGIETVPHNQHPTKQTSFTLADALLGIETTTAVAIAILIGGFTLADALLGIETGQLKGLGGRVWVSLWLMPF